VTAVRRGGALTIYVDGREAASAHGAITGPVTTDAPLRIGEDEAGRYGGRIGDVRTYGRALDGREIEALAAAMDHEEARA
jgi:hypothetical protein